MQPVFLLAGLCLLLLGVSAWFCLRFLSLRRQTSALSLHRSTDHGLAQSSLRLRETHLRLVVQQMGAIFWTVDTEMRFIFCHGPGLAKLGLDADEVVGMSL